MATLGREKLEALLTDFEKLLEQESEHIRNADIAKLETFHFQKENSMATIRKTLGISEGSLCYDDFEKFSTMAGETYRSIARRLKENLGAAEAIRDLVRKQINELDRPATVVRTFSRLEPDAEASSVDISY